MALGWRTWVLSLALVVSIEPTQARACSCLFEGPGRFYLGVDGKLPRDALGIPWRGFNDLLQREVRPRPITDRVTLKKLVDGRAIAVGFTIQQRGPIDFIVPDGGLRAGDRYSVAVREYGGWATPWRQRDEEEFRRRFGPRRRPARSEPLPLAFELAADVVVTEDVLTLAGVTLRLSPRGRQMVRHFLLPPSSCGGEAAADVITVSAVLPPELEPYRDYLLYETEVDGVPRRDRTESCQVLLPGRTWAEEAGVDQMFSECAAPRVGLQPGLHAVSMKLSPPDAGRQFVTPSALFELDCADLPTSSPAPVTDASPPLPVPADASPPVATPSVVEPPVTDAAAVQGPAPVPAPRGCATVGSPCTIALVPLLRRRRRPRG